MTKERCAWCGRSRDEVDKLIPGPVIRVCGSCISRLAGGLESEESTAAEKVRQEVDRAVQDSFSVIFKQLNFGPLQEKYQRLMRVKFKEEPGSPTFQEVFQEFKKGVEAELALDDFQARYDLAIAYHEMGLDEDAFREMLASLRGALRQKDFDRAGEIMSALFYIHADSARAIRGIYRVMSEAEVA